MAAILLAGGPGAGKSTVSQWLRDRDLRSIDLDYGYARFEDEAGVTVDLPPAPGLGWLTTHHWNWIDSRLAAAVADSADHTTVLAGTAFNMTAHLDRFALLLVLCIGDATLKARVTAPERNNVFGKKGDTAEWSLGWRDTVEAALEQRGAIMIDAERPIDQVAEDVISSCAAEGYPIAGVS
ncbi:hypothetical protein [Microlunatus speluncae]|uniref:hypothetical protein n=1 Tax=Microlunatus speluncae TaxID=2594267 RepID=UPI0012666D04|nr:hypothetical protein [Microlunatus speluncae]